MTDHPPEGIAALVASLRTLAATPLYAEAGETWIDQWVRDRFQAAAEALERLEKDLAEQNGTTHALNLAAKLRKAKARADAAERELPGALLKAHDDGYEQGRLAGIGIGEPEYSDLLRENITLRSTTAAASVRCDDHRLFREQAEAERDEAQKALIQVSEDVAQANKDRAQAIRMVSAVDEKLKQAEATVARQVGELTSLELRYRQKLWAAHAHPFPMRYGDDGEMQCGGCDFKRQSLEECERHCHEAALAAIEAETGGKP